MKTFTRFILSTEEKQAIKNVVDTINCSCECQEHEPCPFLMNDGGCMLEALSDIVEEQIREDY